MRPNRTLVGGLAALALTATACSSGSSAGSAPSTTAGSTISAVATSTGATTAGASAAGTSSADASSADASSAGSSSAAPSSGGSAMTAAQTSIAPYVDHPSPFPATEKLAKLPKSGSKFIFLQCSAPVCAIFAQLMAAPAKQLGVAFSTVNSGASATTSQTAAATALSQKPAALLVGASNPQLYGDYLHKLVAAGSVVAGGGTVGGTPYGVQDAVGGEHSVTLAGQLLANWVTVRKSGKANVVFFGTPELTFSQGMQAGFGETLAKNCPACKLDNQQLSVTTFGTSAPNQVISYLQAHPAVDTVVFASMEGATGLAAALRNAHLSPTTIGFAPTPSNLQDIAQGGLTAGLGLDFNVQVWMQLNLAARLIAGQTTSASNLVVDMEFLTKQDLAGKNVSLGWTGYPDVAQRFATLWGTAG